MPDIMDIRLLDDKAAPNCEPEKPMERATLPDRKTIKRLSRRSHVPGNVPRLLRSQM